LGGGGGEGVVQRREYVQLLRQIQKNDVLTP